MKVIVHEKGVEAPKEKGKCRERKAEPCLWELQGPCMAHHGLGRKPERRTRKSPEKIIGARESKEEGTDAE